MQYKNEGIRMEQNREGIPTTELFIKCWGAAVGTVFTVETPEKLVV